jgi:serine/threonine protein kinase/tetratricopeptide (TPR) repeat protein
MNPDRWCKIDQLLDELLESEPSRRNEFLDEACQGDDALRHEVESLLLAHEQSEGFIEALPTEPVANLFPPAKSVLGSSLAHYHVLSSLGAGGMSEVYLARDTKLGRLVALKLLPAQDQDKKRIDRFRQEACAASALNHPNILTVYEIGEQSGYHFIVTEYVEGETLRQQIMRERITPNQAVDFAAQIAGALDAAHATGIVHRDIKPDNIMVRPDRLVKVLDFGIAKLMQHHTFLTASALSTASPQTDPGTVVGTINYMSPEQIRGRDVDARSDLFSLGVVLYEMLAGVRPFTGDTPGDVVVALIERDPPPLAAFVQGVPAELERIVVKSLAKSPDKRYLSANDLLSDLRALARQLEVDAAQPKVYCPQCGQENPGDFGYCSFCRAALRRVCPRCNKETLPSNQFCGLCGSKFEEMEETVLIDSPAPTDQRNPALHPVVLPGAERRPATVVYATVSGCAAILEHFDPDEADEIINSIKSGVTEVITSHGGIVNRCSGEELVALFGVPSSSEDDFLRAVRAGISLRARLNEYSDLIDARLGRRLRVSIGISSGPVVTWLQDDEQYNVTGDALQIASRLAAQAEADEILLSPETQRLVAPFFRLGEKGSHSLQPGDDPVTVCRVEGESGARTRLEAAEVAGLTPYTGREKEFGALLSSLERSLAGEGQFVVVVGDAGVGKSRLLLEFCRAIEQQSITLLQSRCQSRRTSTSYGPFIDALRNLLGLQAETTSESSRVTAVAGVRAISTDLEGYIQVYLHLLSIQAAGEPNNDIQGDDLRFAIQEALAAIFTLHAKRGPTVLLLEDWHWADEGSGEVLKRLAGFVPSYPLMVVVTCRPDRVLDWRSIETQTVLQLAPLDELSSTRIVRSIFSADELPEGLGELLYRRTGGNPFFIEEVCRTLVEEVRVEVSDGVARLRGSLEDLQLPDTVQTVIRTRLDRLDVDSQTVLRHASVMGREFNLPMLERMMESKDELRRRLATLQKHGLIQQVRVVPELAYRFKHILTQEVVYDGLLAHQRKALHEAAGRAIEALYKERLEEHLELLTYHYSRAEIWERAARYGREAAEKASRLSRFSEALSILDQTETWLSKLQETPERKESLVSVLLQQERLCETLGLRERQQELINRILTLAESSNNRALIAEARVRQGELGTLLGRFDEAEAALAESLSIRRELGDSDGERIVLRNMGFLYWRTGRYEDAVKCNNTALEIDRARDDSAGYTKDLTNLASILRTQGRSREALSYLREAFQINEALNRPLSQVYTLAVLANTHRDLGEADLAMGYFRHADQLTIQHHLPLHRVVILSLMSSTCWQRGEVEESIGLCRELVTLTRNHGVRKELARALETLSERLLALDRSEEALPTLREAAEVFAALGEVDEQARMLASVAYVCERQSLDHGNTLAVWDKVRSLKSARQDVTGEIEALEGMARVARGHVNDSRLALECLRQAQDLVERVGDVAKLGELLNTAAIIEWTNRNYPAALAGYEEALGIFRRLGDKAHSGLMLNSIGVTLNKLGRHDEAIERLEEALNLHRESGERLLEGHALAALGDVCCETGAHERAQRYYQASLEIRRERRDRKGEGWMLSRLAEVLAAQGDRREARRLLADAILIADEIADDQLNMACQNLEDRNKED